MKEQLFLDNIQIPLLNSINPSLTYSVADISQPDKRKSTYSKTISIPNSKIANKLFGGIYDINLTDGSFDTSKKIDMYYLVDGELIIEGYAQLISVDTTDNNDINYNILLFGNTANLFSKAKGKYLSDLDISIYNHPLVKEAIEQSWDFQILENGLPVPFELGKGYVYPLIDYGYTTDQITYQVGELSPAIYAKEYWDRIFEANGFTYTSAFIDSERFKREIIPSDPTIYAMTEADILARQFSVNTPQFLSTGTIQSPTLPAGGNSNNFVINMTNDVTDPSLIYDNTTGEYSPNFNGQYNLNAIVDIDTTFTPDNLLTNLEVTSEVRGKIRIVKNGLTVLDELDFYISPLGFTTGSRNTVTPPPSSEDTHRQMQSNNMNAISNGRVQNPSNRYQLNINNVTLLSSDVITVAYNAGWVGIGGVNMFEDTFGSGATGNAYLDISVGGFSNIALNQSVGYGNTFDLNKAIPNKYLQTDFLKDVIKKFNLQIQPDQLNTNNFIIEPYNDYYLSDTVNDWSEKHAINKPFTLTPTGKLKNLTYSFSYKEDKDYYNSTYLEQWQEVYGYREVTAVNDFLKGEHKTELTLSPTPIVGDPNGEIVIPRIIKLDDSAQANPTKFNRRMLYYGGLLGNPAGGVLLNPWKLDWSTATVPQNNYYYPYCGHFDNPFNPTYDTNFGLVKEVYYDDNIAPIVVTNNNLYNIYYKDMMEGILDPNGKVFEGYFHLTPIDIYKLSFRDLFYHNNAYWRLMKITNYNPTSSELVKCEFQKEVKLTVFAPTTIPSYGDDAVIEKSGTIIDDSEQTPVKNKAQFKQLNENSFNNFTAKVSGSNNYVNRTSKDVEILGDNNRVSSNSKNIRLVNSDNNFIGSGVENVTLINSHNLEVLESDVTYIDGLRQNRKTKYIDTASFTVSNDVILYLLDTDLTGISTTLPATTIDGLEWTFKNIGHNKITLIETSILIDGNQKIDFLDYQTSVTVRYSEELNTYKIVSIYKEHDDHHSGFNSIGIRDIIVIDEDKQMINYDGLTINGDLDINGDLILK